MTGIEKTEVRTGEESVMRGRGTGIEVENTIGNEIEIEVMIMIEIETETETETEKETETENMDGNENVNVNVTGSAPGTAVDDLSIREYLYFLGVLWMVMCSILVGTDDFQYEL